MKGDTPSFKGYLTTENTQVFTAVSVTRRTVYTQQEPRKWLFAHH